MRLLRLDWLPAPHASGYGGRVVWLDGQTGEDKTVTHRTKEQRQEMLQRIKDAAAMVDDRAIDAFLTTTACNFSRRNVAWILAQCPDATVVAGFQQWKQAGRTVRKGERGLAILVPTMRKDKDTGEDLAGFRVGYVFDVSQTDELVTA